MPKSEESCYVCGRPVQSVTLAEQLEAQRARNVPVVLGPGIVRHSYCAPGTERWFAAMRDGRTLTARDKFWLRVFALEAAR